MMVIYLYIYVPCLPSTYYRGEERMRMREKEHGNDDFICWKKRI